MLDNDHDCPKRGCPERLPFETLACKRHWFALPSSLRRSLSVLWMRGDIDAYLAKRAEAVAVLNGEAEVRS